MAEGFIQLPPDGTGKKLRARSRVIGVNTVYEQAITHAAMDTWTVMADAVVPASGKHHISIFNGSGSGKVVRVQKLFCILNLSVTTAITGVVNRFDVRRTTAQSAGTTLTPTAQDTTNTAIPAQILIATNATVTNSSILMPNMILLEEPTVTQAITVAQFMQFQNLLVEGPETQEYVLRETQGLTVHQPGTAAVGNLTWVMSFTVE